MLRRAFCSLLLLALAIFSSRISGAQQPAPAARPATAPKVRFDAYKNLKFRVAIQGRYLAGFSKMAINLTVASEPQRGPATEKLPGRIKYESITLERGVTHDSSFAQWAGQTQGNQQSRDLVIDAFNEAGQKSTTNQLTGCLVAEYQSLPDLDGGANSVTIEHMKLRCRGVK
jgi:phage tail-like protein